MIESAYDSLVDELGRLISGDDLEDMIEIIREVEREAFESGVDSVRPYCPHGMCGQCGIETSL